MLKPPSAVKFEILGATSPAISFNSGAQPSQQKEGSILEASLPRLIPLTPAATSVIQACVAAGGQPWLVGGLVRDAMMAHVNGIEMPLPSDVDIEVEGTTLEALREAMPGASGIQGTRFPILQMNIGDESFDIFVRDKEPSAGSPPDILESVTRALARRDLTMNSMAWNPLTGQLIDLFGGLDDIRAGVLRHTGPAFTDEPLHVLRLVRFAGRFNFAVAPESKELCRTLAATFPQLPKTRVWKEFRNLALQAPHISHALNVLHDIGWEANFPSLVAVRNVPQDISWHPEGAVHIHLGLAGDSAAAAAERNKLSDKDRVVVVLAAILHDLGKATHTAVEDSGRITSRGHAMAGVEPARFFLNQIGAPHHVKAKILPIIREHMSHVGTNGSPSKTVVRRLARRLAGTALAGPSIALWAAVVDADLTGRAEGNKEVIGAKWLARAESLNVSAEPTIPLLKGRHAIAVGFAPRSKEIGDFIRASVEAQEAGEFSDEAGAIEWARRNSPQQQSRNQCRGQPHHSHRRI